MLKHNKQQSPYKAIQDSPFNTPQLTQFTEISNTETQYPILNSQSTQKYRPITHQTSKRPIPIGNKSKDKISSMKKSRHNTDEYFEKQLEIRQGREQFRTLQSKKLMEELHETQSKLSRTQKECWFAKNQYQSEKRKVGKYQKENVRLIEEVKELEKRIRLVKKDVCEKQNLDEKYLENLKSLKEQLKEKDVVIQKLKAENSKLLKQKQDLSRNIEVNEMKQIQNIKRQRQKYRQRGQSHTDLEQTGKFTNRILPPPPSIPELQQRSHRLFTQSLSKQSSSRDRNIYIPSRQNEFLKPKYQTIQTCSNLQQLSTNLSNLKYDSNRYKMSSTIQYPSRSQNYQRLYYQNQKRYPPSSYSSRRSSRDEKRFSYDYNNFNQTALVDITRKYRNNQRLTSRKFRKDKVNESIINRCNVILDY